MPISLTDDLRQEYQNLFNTCVVNPARLALVNGVVSRIAPGRSRYQAVGDPLGIPWYFIGLVHNLEASLNFNCHLHNGDPLTARTVHVPAGRPPASVGDPPFTWEQSATDALQFQGFANESDWSLPHILYRLEAYNGFGYRRHGVPTPYLWSFSNHYTRGKFVADGVFDADAVSNQCGAAVVLSQMVHSGLVSFASPAAAP